MRIFQFLAVQPPEPAARLIRASARSSSTVVLDLEDALWDVADEARTRSLKADGRANLVGLARSHPELFASQPIGIRVNRVGGPESESDFEALGEASRFVEFECVVVPKLDTGGDLESCAASIEVHGVACRSVVPILETRRAVANVDGLLVAARRAGVDWIVYGHYDYALDCGWWPIPEHTEPAFWDRVVPLVERLEGAGLGYVHPPYFHTHDDAGMARILDRLGRTCRREFGILTVDLHQTSVVNRIRSDSIAPAPEPASTAALLPPAESPLAMAHRIVNEYRANYRPGNGFTLDSRSGEFIPPHEYLAACAYIGQVEHG
jgi:citrate lyase beta subunit